MSVPLWAWLAFAGVVVIMLAVDLLAHRGAHVIGFREAAAWSGVWVGVSLIFVAVQLVRHGRLATVVGGIAAGSEAPATPLAPPTITSTASSLRRRPQATR